MKKQFYLITTLLTLLIFHGFSQSITNYTFAPASGTFTALTGATATTGYGTGNVDEGYWNTLPIGFDFYYMGTRYTTISASTNGWLTLGANITNATFLNNLSTGGTPRPVLAPLWDNLNIQTGANATFLTSGTAGNQIFTLELLNNKWNYVASGNTISFQVKLYEATGKIQYVYRQDAAAVNAGSASIGIAANATGSGNFLSLNGTGTAPAVSSTTETSILNTKPATGQTYSFTPPVPAAPTFLTFSAVASTSMMLNWIDNSSNETGFAIYQSTDGVNYAYVTKTIANAVSSSQTGLTAGTTYYWRIYAVSEGALSTALSANKVACTDISQIPTGNIVANYPMDGNADEATGINNGTLQNAPAAVANRFNVAGKAFSFNGTSQYISTANSYANPNNFTISIWFKTASVTGGKLIGFGNASTGSSSNYDRHIYMNNAGKLYFGVYPNTVVTVNSALSYNDNNWHLATASLSSTTGMVLYVDGAQVGSNTATVTAQNYTGYWRIGYDNNNGWTSQPASFYFNGILDDALIYHRTLTPAEVAVLYVSPDGAGSNGPVCSGSTLFLSATTVGSAVYGWTGPNSYTSAVQNPSLAYTSVNAGVYTLQVTAAGCTSTAYTTVTSSSNTGQWTGTVNTDWSNAGNWCSGTVPTSVTNVTIATGATNMPNIITSVSCNNLNINAGATLTTSLAGTLNIAGTLTNNGTINNSGTINFNGTSGQQTFSGVTQFYNLTVSNTAGLLLPVAITVNNNLTLTSGILTTNNFNIAVKGNWVNNASATALAPGTATVTFSGSTAQSIGGTFATPFNNLTIFNTGNTVSQLVNTNISGNLSVATGTFDLASFTANRTVAGGVLTVSNNATLKIGGTNTFPINYATNTLVAASTVDYSGTNQTVANQAYGNLNLSSSGGAVVKTFPTTALDVLGNLTSTIGAGTSVSFTAGSNITVSGNVSIGASTTFNGGSYSHSIRGNWINSGMFTGSTSTVTFVGPGAAVSGSGVQNFNNLTVAASPVTFSNGNITLTGNLATTGPGSLSQASGGTILMTGTGTTISGSGIAPDNLTISGTVSTTASLNITGNLSVSGSFTASAGVITMSGASKTITGAGTKSFATLYVTGAVTTDANFLITSGLSVIGSLSASAGTCTFTGTSTLSGTPNLFNLTINGTSLQLSANSIAGIANALTITAGILNVTSSAPNTVNFNGTGAQSINAITYCNLVLSNGNTKTAAGNITTTFDINIGSGTTFIPSSYTLSIYGNWINNGTFTAGTSTVEFLGPATAYLTGATTFNVLTSNASSTTTALILNSNISATTVNMTNGIITTGSNTITITGTRTGPGFIYGTIQRTHAFTTGVAYAFEGADNTVSFTSLSGVTSITVYVNKGVIADFPFGGSVARVYTVTVPSGTYNATLRLHYEDGELNGNDESSMTLWNYNGTTWGSIGKSANNTTSNYVEKSGLTIMSNRYAFSDNSNVVEWNGSVSTDWNTAANWTVAQGSASRPPVATDIANLGTGAFTNQPSISTAVNVKNINFGSVQAVALTMASGGSLTTGDVNGTWGANAIHTINVNNQTVTVNGDLVLSGGVSGQAIDLNIGSGTVNVSGVLTQSGGANITFTGAGNLNLGGDYNYISGTFTPATGTVTYNGANNQLTGTVGYNNLSINKASAIASINNTTNVAGNFNVIAGEVDNASLTTIAGNVTISPGAIFQNFSLLHVKGNWLNNGTFTATAASIFFDGPGTQTISASTFNNFNINKPVGSVAQLTGAIAIKGDFNITSGTLNTKSFDFNRNVFGGAITIADLGTLIMGANYLPTNFANGTIGNASTIIFDGTGAQAVPLPFSFGNLIFRNAGVKTLSAPITVNGDLTIESGSSFDGGANTITLNGNWSNSGTFTPSTSTLLLTGITKTISGNTIFNRMTVPGSYTFLNNMTFNGLLNITTGSLNGGSSILTTLNGDLRNSGTLYTLGTTTFTGNVLQTLSLINAVQTVAITVNFNGTVSPVLNSTSAPQYGFLNINNTGGVNPSVGWTVAYGLTVGSGASFNGGPSTHNILGYLTNNGTITSNGVINFVPATATTVNLGSNFSSTGTVVFGGAGAMTLAGSPGSLHNVVISSTNIAGISPSSAWNMANNLTVLNGSILNAGNYIHLLRGNLSNQGIINSGTSTFTLNGTGQQDITGTSALNNVTINKASGVANLLSNTTINGVLNFIAGQIQTGANSIIQPSAGTVTGAAQTTGWVNGNFQKNIATGTTTKNFEIGDGASYTPVSTAFTGVSTPGNLTIFTTAGDYANLSASPINEFKSVNRYWTLINTGIVFTDYAATFNFAAGDIDAGASTAAFNVANDNGSSWNLPVTASPNPLNITATGLTLFNYFVIGEICNKGTTISYALPVYCTNAGTLPAVLTGNGGGTFSSSAGLSINSATGTIDLSASTPGTYIVNYDLASTVQCASYKTTATIKVGVPGMWTGALSNAWFDVNNWGCAVPGAATDAIIPGGLSFYPTITGTYPVNNLTIQTGATLTITGGTLQIAGTIANSGTFDVSAGTIELKGSSPQTIPANAFVSDNIQNLIVSNNVILGGQLNLTGALSFGASNQTITTGGNLTLKSTATGTARVADITNAGANTGNLISGTVTIERYISPKRAWHLLASPVAASGAPNINAAWQEGVVSTVSGTQLNPTPGYGMPITGGTSANGFDQGLFNNGSVRTYNSTTNSFTNLPSTNAPITNYPAYFVFIRGNRSTNLSLATAAPLTPTTLRMKGLINTGNVAVTINAANYTLVGNPYPAAVNFQSLTKSNVNDKVWFVDPKLAGSVGTGGYVAFIWNSSTLRYDSTTMAGPLSRYIQSGAGFYVETTDHINPGMLTFKEADKNATGSPLVFRPVYGAENIRVNLFAFEADGTPALQDGVLITYGDNNVNAVDQNDAVKFFNQGPNLSIATSGSRLAIERRLTIETSDTSFLNINTLTPQNYRLQITTEAMENSGLQAILKDNYSAAINNTALNMNGVTDVDFTVDADPASKNVGRFSIVFKKQANLPVSLQVKAYQQQKNIIVECAASNEINVQEYIWQTSPNGTDFINADTQPAKANNGGNATYIWQDANVTNGLHFYRVTAKDITGKLQYSPVVKVNISDAPGTISVYPNPVTGTSIGLQLKDLTAGKYTIRLIDQLGQVLLSTPLQHLQGNTTEKIVLPKFIASGIYKLEITSPNNSVKSIVVAIQQ